MKITVEVNGKAVKLTEFPSKIMVNVLEGMLKSLRGVDEIKSAVVKLSAE